MTKRLNSLALFVLALRSPSPLKRDEGQTLAEYALILALVAVFVVAFVTLLGHQIAGIFTQITSGI